MDIERTPLGRHPPSPADGWRRELIYFALPDRFSDGGGSRRPALQYGPDGAGVVHEPFPGGAYDVWRWDLWAISGHNRFQGGTIRGMESKLPYLADLGVTALWIGPVWKQRAAGTDQNLAHDGTDDLFLGAEGGLKQGRRPLQADKVVFPSDTYHGYAVQDFDSIDPRFGSEADLIRLVERAHDNGIRVIFDILINHSAPNFHYDTPVVSPLRPPYPPPDGLPDGKYSFGSWLDAENRPLPEGAELGPDDGVWPASLQKAAHYSRMGEGDYRVGQLGDFNAEFRIADWRNRDFGYRPDDEGNDALLDVIVGIWTGWIDRTDCDGFRVDTFKHVPRATATRFVERVREHAERLGKQDFLVVGEIGGGDSSSASFLDIPGLHVLELGERRAALRALAGGDTGVSVRSLLIPSAGPLEDQPWIDADTRDRLKAIAQDMPTAVADRTVTSIDDHDGLYVNPTERMARTHGSASVVPAAALLLFGPGVPCLYYGTEQALRGPVGEGTYLGSYGMDPRDGQPTSRGVDRYLREAMFGPRHPRRAGLAGRPSTSTGSSAATFDRELPGFGAMGTTGMHVFTKSAWYVAIAELAGLRQRFPVLATGSIQVLDAGRTGDGSYAGALPANVVVWLRQDDPGGPVGIIAVNVAKPGSPAALHAQDVDVALPLDTTVTDLVLRATVSEDLLSTAATTVKVDTRPQSGRCYLNLGAIAPSSVQVYTSGLAG